MQLVKSGFNSPASFNFLPCLLINESALAALGIPWFFHIQENSTQWLNSRGLKQAMSLSFEAASLWISLPQKHLQTLSSPWQLHLISLQGPLAQGSCVTLSSLSLCGIPCWKCSPSRFSAPGLAVQGHMLLSGAVPMAALLCCVRHAAGAIWALSPPRASSGTSRVCQGLLSPSHGPGCVTSRCAFSKDSGTISARWCCQALPQTFRAVRKCQSKGFWHFCFV